jgi:rod shape determining protein RodA
MSPIFSGSSIKHYIQPWLKHFDAWFMLAVLFLSALGLMAMYSAGYDHGERFSQHGRNMLLALGIFVLTAQVPPQRLVMLALPLFSAGVALLIATALFGITKKGATRWIYLGVVIQPSEIMKIAMPLMMAWWFHRREGMLRVTDFMVSGVLLLIPVALILKQPDLGTAILVFASGFFVIFFAGLSWRFLIPVVALGLLGLGLLVYFGDAMCASDQPWPGLHDYQKQRVCTLLDPTADPLGKGFHIIQGTIAIGSGGIWGKGFMQGTQTHLEFIPERTTDFIFAAYGEEFGLLGVLVLLVAFLLLILRCLWISAGALTLFSRLIAGSIDLSLFTYVFVNIGMVSGILPVVGIPLPFISYGGTSMVMMGLTLGMVMSIARQRGFLMHR